MRGVIIKPACVGTRTLDPHIVGSLGSRQSAKHAQRNPLKLMNPQPSMSKMLRLETVSQSNSLSDTGPVGSRPMPSNLPEVHELDAPNAEGGRLYVTVNTKSKSFGNKQLNPEIRTSPDSGCLGVGGLLHTS